ncbi:MAG TPA: class I SAM-dependent methyltransferase [Planctomycetota bacterium]|nr:class I SAM-dependent methyltransferase [Planctomycetota bacterium]
MPGKDELRAQWAAFAAEWIARMDEKRDDAREGLLDDWMLGLCGDVRGLSAIDLGCGEGRFCRMLAARGATALGVDLQPAFLERARTLGGPGEEYRLCDIETLEGVPDASFDLAISYITLVDVEDVEAAARQAHRVLRPRGRLLVANLAPMATARGFWLRDEEKRKLHWILDDYAQEGPRSFPFPSGHVVTGFHRTMGTMLNTFLGTGFTLRALHEPTPTPEQLRRAPGNDDLFRVPIYVIYDFAKA